MKYFKFKKLRDGNRALYLREKKDMYDKPKETYISKKGSLIIYGINASGKSHKLKTILKNADELWNKEEVIYFKATDALSEILHKNLPSDEEAQKLLHVSVNGEDEEVELIDVKKQYVKFDALIEKSKKSVVMIDDVDKISGKKLELVKDLLRNCKRFVLTAQSETSINRTLRNIIDRRKISIASVHLSSKASVDATNLLFAAMVLGLFATGMHEAAILIMAGRYIMKGSK